MHAGGRRAELSLAQANFISDEEALPEGRVMHLVLREGENNVGLSETTINPSGNQASVPAYCSVTRSVLHALLAALFRQAASTNAELS
jgi:hypothetical protein